MSETKYCPSCKQWKPISEFGRDISRPSHKRVHCRECANAERRVWGKNNPERRRAIQQNYRNSYEISWKGKYARLRAYAHKQANPFLISPEDFKEWYDNQEKICFYCGTRLRQRNQYDYDNLTLDHRDNSGGYVLANLVLCCRRCNTIKGSWFSAGQMLEIAQKYLNKEVKWYRQ